MHLIYNLLFFVFLLASAPYYLVHMLLKEHYRAGFFQRLGFIPPVRPTGKRRVWLHGVSVGEIQPMLRLAGGLGDFQCVFSTTTLTAQRLARRLLGPAAELIFFPLDIPWAVRRSLGRVQPHVVLVGETELWPNFLRECRRRKIPVVIVNGRISDRSFKRYGLIPAFTRRCLPLIDLFLMQSEEYARRIREMGAPPERVRVTGNMKADDAQDRPVADDLEKFFEIIGKKGARVLVAGSTHPGEESLLLRQFARWQRSHPNLLLVLAPRHPSRIDDVIAELRGGSRPWRLRSELGQQPDGETQILLLDTLGELSSLYRFADAVFIGKTLLSRGGQNPMEAARWAKPIVFGPHMENFPLETEMLLKHGGAMRVEDEEQLAGSIEDLLSDPKAIASVGAKAKAAVDSLQGATQRNLEMLRKYFTNSV